VAGFTERQKEIIEASIRLIADGGIQELTIKNISRAIGISEPALYRHFDNKLAILQGLLDFFADGSRAVFERVAGSEQPALEKVHAVLTAHFDQFAKVPPLSAVLFSEEIFQNDGILAGKVLEIMDTGQSFLLKIVRQGMVTGELRGDLPAEHLVVIIMGALRLTVTKWRLLKYGFDLRREGDTLWGSLRAILSPA
jgi:AcrR family transcriptional regulator